MLFTDPGWFFWAHRGHVLLNQGIYGGEELTRKASRLRIPGNHGAGLVVEYALDPRAGGQPVVQLVPEAVGGEGGGTTSFTHLYIGLSIPSQLAPYDKTGGKIIVNFLKVSYCCVLGGRTRRRCWTGPPRSQHRPLPLTVQRRGGATRRRG